MAGESNKQEFKVEVSTNSTEKKQKSYDERHKIWATKALEQLGFANSLIITLSIAFLGFLFSEKKTICDFKFLYLSTIGTCYFSIFFGLLTVVSRLYDFKISRNITLLRKKYFEQETEKLSQNSKELKELKELGELPRPQKGDNTFLHSMYVVLRVFFYPTEPLRIDTPDFNNSFIDLSKLGSSLGIASWRFFKVQIGLFILSIFLYSIWFVNIFLK